MLCYEFIVIIFTITFSKISGDNTINNLCLEPITSSLKHPTTVIPKPPDGKLLVGEHPGVIYLLHDSRGKNKDVFLNITDRVFSSSNPGDERGLLSFALDPDFEKNPYLYVCYSSKGTSNSTNHKTVVSRFTCDKDLKKANKTTEKKIIEIHQPGERQNGGHIFFGIDGNLYITTGDGGDLGNKRFDKTSLLGKIIRIDVNNDRCKQSYCIPEDNPFYGKDNMRNEIYAYGFRNVWRCSVDEGNSATDTNRGRIICGDNGEEPPNVEEINIIIPGGRYGWMDSEDSECHSLSSCRDLYNEKGYPIEDQLPIYTYSHPDGQAFVGGVMYRGKKIPSLNGSYVFADFVHTSMHYLKDSHKGWLKKGDISVRLCKQQHKACGKNNTKISILGLSTDQNGEIIVMTTENLNSSSPTGALYRLVNGSTTDIPFNFVLIAFIVSTISYLCNS